MAEQITKPKFNSVLLIDDVKEDLFIGEWALNTAFGIKKKNIYKKHDATEALDFLEKIEKKEALPDIIIVDIQMPVTDGFEFLRKLAHHELDVTSFCKILVASSYFPEYTKSDLKERAKEFSFPFRYIEKPLTLENLNKALSN